MSRVGNELAADRWVQVSGSPLGDARLEYRNLYKGSTCLACYIYSQDEPMDLPAYQAALRR